MFKRLIAAFALLLSLAAPVAAIDVSPGGGGAAGAAAGGAAVGTGTTSGTSTTGFGKQWFPSNLQNPPGGGNRMGAAFFIDDLNVAILHRSTACANCIVVEMSSDGGVNFSRFNTATIIGNDLQIGFAVPTNPVRYIVARVATGVALDIFQSTNLLSGWTQITGFGLPSPAGFASNENGTTVLAVEANGANLTVRRSVNGGISFPTNVVFGTTGIVSSAGGGITFAGGANWLTFDEGGAIWRSTNDGASFTQVATLAQGRAIKCLAPTFVSCIFTATDTNIYRSADGGATWAIQQTGVPASSGMCDYGGNVIATLPQSPPVGLGTIEQTVFTSFNGGLNWFAGQINGSPRDGTGTPLLTSFACRNGRGIAGYQMTGGGGINQFSLYNPLTAPGGTLSSSAGGYTVAAPIQAGIILNAAPTVSAANTAAVITLTNTPGSRVCIREIALISSAASAVVTLTVTDGAVLVLNYGTPATGIVPIRFSGVPLLCSQTNNNLIVNIGAAGVAITTTTSVIADRYPN